MGFIDFFRSNKPLQTEIVRPNDEQKDFEQSRITKRTFQNRRDSNELELMLMEQQLRKLDLQAQIQDREAELFGEEEPQTGDNPDAMLYGLLSKVLTQNQNPVAAINPTVSTNTSSINADGISLSDEEIQKIYNDLPTTYKTIAKGLSDEQIKEFIKQKQPNISLDTLSRAVLIIRKNK